MRYSDVVGDLVALSGTAATVETRDGAVVVPLAEVALARLAPPSTADELELERVVAACWRAEHTGELGGWLLRANGGFTGRANSVLPLRPPGLPLAEALAAARAWYAERGLPLVFQVPTEARRLLDAALGELGWPADEPVHVLVARLDRLPDALHPDVGIAAEPDDAWLGRFRDGAGRAPAARGVLTRHERACFASVRRDDATVAIGRGTLDAGWLGVTAVEVDPRYRRQGLARAVMGALAGWGRAQGAVRAHLEVTAANTAAVALYESLGYWRHHDYHYRREPAS